MTTGWTEAAFFAWAERQDGRYEFVDGQPRAMVGATQRHSRIAVNLLVALDRRLRGGPCRAGGPDLGIHIPAGNVRYPDVSVNCRPFLETERVATEPRLVAEVLSPSTMDFDRSGKLDEYRTVPGLAHVLIVDHEQARVRLYSRGPDGAWDVAVTRGLGAEVTLPAIGLSVPLREMYDGLTFRALPRLVVPETEDGTF